MKRLLIEFLVFGSVSSLAQDSDRINVSAIYSESGTCAPDVGGVLNIEFRGGKK